MEITKASSQELPTILTMYHVANKELQENDIYQWDKQDPSQEVIKENIEDGILYVAKKESEILGSVVLDEKGEPEHEQVEWLNEEEDALYLKRLVVHPEHQGEGTGKKLMNFAEDYAHKHNYSAMRLEAYEENEIARNLYKQYGFQELGKIYYPRRDIPFVCYEKPLH